MVYSRSVTLVLVRFYSVMDILSVRIIWLSVGIVLAILSGSVIKSRKLLWWWLTFVLILRFTRRNLLYFYIFFEMRLIPILILIISLGTQPERLSAGSYLLFYTTFLSVPYLVFIIFISLNEFNLRACYWRSGRVSLVLLSPFLVKIPMFGLHFWLPKAHVEARTRGSIVLAGILLKLGRYGAARIVFLFSIRVSSSWLSVIWVILALMSRLVTLIQTDLKKLVAYRRVTHITFLIVGLFTSTKITLARVILVSLSHGWAAICIFAVAGSLSHRTFSRLGTLIGSETRLFWIMIILGLILISNAGIPPMPSFFPEVFLVLRCIVGRGYCVLVFLFLRMIVCYYNAYLFLWVSHFKPSRLSRSKFSFLERLVFFSLFLLRIQSLFWLQAL